MDPAALEIAMSQHPPGDASAQDPLLNPNVLSLSVPPLPEGQVASTRPSRKRTKTGCLTCRKRRIKCGEERPTCNNCIKSKRHCEGYNQRVVFKDHLSAYRHGSLAAPPEFPSALLYPQSSMPGVPQLGSYEPSSFAGPVSLPALAPRPSAPFVFTAHPGWPMQPGPAAPGPGHADAASYVLPAAPGVAPQEGLVSPTSHAYHPTGQAHIPSEQPPPFEQCEPHLGHTKSSPTALQPPHFAPSAAIRTTSIHHEAAFDPPYPSPLESSRGHPPAPVSRASGIPIAFADAPVAMGSADGGVGHSYQTQLAPTYLRHASIDAGREPITPTTTPPSYNPAYATPRKSSVQMKPEEPAQVFGAAAPLNTAANTGPFVTRAEPYAPIPRTFPVQSSPAEDASTGFDADDDVDIDLSSPDDVARPAEYIPSMPDSVGSLVARHTASDDRAARTLTDWLNEPNLLATYRPSPLASQLMDPKAARIFCHFITSTGPAFSIYERHPVNPSAIFMGGPVPSSQKSLWTYTLPTLALSSPALMHAMLALGALHISKLQGGATTVSSLKHYHLALRRVARQVSLPAKRSEVATLAATLLLGLWEVMATEHAKWNSHLLGACQLLDEYDFAGMTKRIKRLRAHKDAQRRQWLRPEMDAGVTSMQPESARKVAEEAAFASIQDVDENLVGIFMGQAIRYDGLGVVKIETDDPTGGTEPELTRHDVEDYELRRDLFWWFAKQDMYQSLLSGNRLLSDFSRWSHCPPRAAIGRREAPYGSSDHMILLLGRIADFAARDQRRKRRVMMEAVVGRGQPSQAGQMHAGTFPPQQAMQMGSHVPGAPQHPVMYGMIPQPTAARRMPAGFQLGSSGGGGGAGNASPGSNTSDDFELEAATVEAEDEWFRIRHALDVFAECLASPHFQPLAAEHMPPAATPFGGPAVFYRTYSIACMWALFHVAHIVLQRAHPSMPPAALAAAAVAAPQTARHAAAVGRIAAALFPADFRAPISPGLGAALSELSLTLFFAGVQFSDGAQRAWLASSLRHVARQTGWDSIAAIAAGCETAWVKAAQMGRGPPYTMQPDQYALSEHIAGRGPHPAAAAKKKRAASAAAAAAVVSDYDDDDGNDVGGPLNPGLRVHRAMGILGVETDLEQLSLD